MSRRFRILMVVPTLALLATAGAALAQRAQGQAERWDEDEVVTLEGTLTEVDRPLATLEVGGKSYVIHLGPTWYWEREGYRVDAGDHVTITGQVSMEGDTPHLYPHSLTRDGRTLDLADADGVPNWRRGRAVGAAPRGGGAGDPPAGCRARCEGCGGRRDCQGGGGCGRYRGRGQRGCARGAGAR